MKLIRLLCTVITLIVLSGCTGCISIPWITGNSSFNSIDTELVTPPPLTKTAVIVPLFGTVSEKWAIDAEKALQDPKNDLVVLWIESPGGSVTETLLLTHKLLAFQKKYNKPIYIYSERILASGAYWVAAAFNKIIVSPAGHVGSIGVYMIRADYSKFYEKEGIKYNIIASDSTKIMGHPATPMESWEHAYWQRSISTSHVRFMKHVWDYRGDKLIDAYKFRHLRDVTTRLDSLQVVSEFRMIANGSLYGANNAVLAGLADDIKYFDDFVKMLQADGFNVITEDGKRIDAFYPLTNADTIKKRAQQKAWDNLNAVHREK